MDLASAVEVAVAVAVAKETTGRDLTRRGGVATVLPVRFAAERDEGKEIAEIIVVCCD